MSAHLVGADARIAECGELLVYVAGLVIIGHSAPALQHPEICHRPEEAGLACDPRDGLGTDGHPGGMADDGVAAVDELIEILPVVLYASAVRGERAPSRHVGPRRCSVGEVAAHFECEFHAEAPGLLHGRIEPYGGLTGMFLGLPECGV